MDGLAWMIDRVIIEGYRRFEHLEIEPTTGLNICCRMTVVSLRDASPGGPPIVLESTSPAIWIGTLVS